ncbi:MAG: fluoride efflux transporter FluC [Thermaurantiacus sp.]
MLPFLLVAAGGAIGSVARYGAWRLAGAAAWPWSTFVVNVSGGLLMGLLTGWLLARGGPEELRLFLGVGILGGFTTFSAYSLDLVAMVERGDWGGALLYGLASMLVAALALAVGLWLGRQLA